MSAGEDKGLRGETSRSCPPPGERRVPARACTFPPGGQNVRGAAGMSPGFRGGCGEGGLSLLPLPGTTAHSHGCLSHAQTDTLTAPLPNRRQEPLEPPQTAPSPGWLGEGGSTLTFARDYLKVGWTQLSRVRGVAPRKGSGGGSRSPSPGPPHSPGAAELGPSLGAAEVDGGGGFGQDSAFKWTFLTAPPSYSQLNKARGGGGETSMLVLPSVPRAESAHDGMLWLKSIFWFLCVMMHTVGCR